MALDGAGCALSELIGEVDPIVGSYGWGRIDMVENRRVGIKSREVYECPGALALLMAHADLEDLTLERDLAHEKARLEPRYAELVYDGLWFSPLKNALDAFVDNSQEHVTGDVRLRCEPPGRCIVAGRRSRGGALRLLACHLRSRRQVPPPRRRGLRHGSGVSALQRGQHARSTTGRDDPLAGPFRRGGRPADELMAYTVSLPYDRRLAAVDAGRLTGTRPGPRGGRDHLRRGRQNPLAALDRVGEELAAGHPRVPGRATRTSIQRSRGG